MSTGGAYLIAGLIAEVWVTYRFAELWITVVVALVGFFAVASLLYGIHQYLKEKLVRIDFDNETITLVNCRGSNPIWSFFAKSVAELPFKEVIRVQRLSGLGTSNPRLITQQGSFVLGIYLQDGGEMLERLSNIARDDELETSNFPWKFFLLLFVVGFVVIGVFVVLAYYLL